MQPSLCEEPHHHVHTTEQSSLHYQTSPNRNDIIHNGRGKVGNRVGGIGCKVGNRVGGIGWGDYKVGNRMGGLRVGGL